MKKFQQKKFVIILETNLFGPIEVMKAVLPQMRETKSGLIINITSICRLYGIALSWDLFRIKGALELITEALRMDKILRNQITNVAPGRFYTNIAAGTLSCTSCERFNL